MTMWSELKQAMESVSAQKHARVAVLTGSAPAFTTGMDLSVFAQMEALAKAESCDGRKREAVMEIIQFFQDCISSPENCRVPVIAAIDGHCIGAGGNFSILGRKYYESFLTFSRFLFA